MSINSPGHSFTVEWPCDLGGSSAVSYDNLDDMLDDMVDRHLDGAAEFWSAVEFLAPGFQDVATAVEDLFDQRLQEISETAAHNAGTRMMVRTPDLSKGIGVIDENKGWE